MPYAPGVQYNPAPIYEGLVSAGRSVAAAREAELQRQFLAQQLQQQQAYGYGIHADELAKDYYSLAQQKQYQDAELSNRARALDITEAGNAPYAPPSEALNDAAAAGYYYLPQSRHGGSYVPRKPVPETPPALGSDPTGTGEFYFNGKVLDQKRNAPGAKMDFGTQAQLESLNASIADKQQKMAELAAGGLDTKTGGFLGMFQHPAQEDFDKHAKELAGMVAKRSSLLSGAKVTGGSDANNPLLPPANFHPAPNPGARAPYSGPAPTPTPPPANYGGYTNPPGVTPPPSTGVRPRLPYAEPPLPVQTPTAGNGTPLPDALPNVGAALSTPDQIKAAFKAGNIDRSTAVTMLRQLGFQP